jgi:glutamyl-tRNA reductase
MSPTIEVTDYGFPGCDRTAEGATMPEIRLSFGKEYRLTTAIIGVGNIGSPLARHLVGGNEPVVLAAKDESRAEALAQELGPLARAASVEDAVTSSEVVVFAGDLHQFGLNGALLELDEARAAVAGAEVPA